MRKILGDFYFLQDLFFKVLDRVIFFNNELDLVGDTDTLDLDPRSFSSRLDIIELEILNEEKTKKDNRRKKYKYRK